MTLRNISEHKENKAAGKISNHFEFPHTGTNQGENNSRRRKLVFFIKNVQILKLNYRQVGKVSPFPKWVMFSQMNVDYQ
jgi:hypothetical protein